MLGANGAGKTTLMRLILGLLAPSAGTVLLFGLPPSRETRRRIGYVPQGLGLYRDLTARGEPGLRRRRLRHPGPGPASRRPAGPWWAACPWACSGRWPSPPPCSTAPSCWSWTSPPPAWPPSPGPASGTGSGSRRQEEWPCWSPPTTWTRPARPTAWCSWPGAGWWAGAGEGDIVGRCPGGGGPHRGWSEAFAALEAAGLAASLAGRDVRLPGAGVDEVAPGARRRRGGRPRSPRPRPPWKRPWCSPPAPRSGRDRRGQTRPPPRRPRGHPPGHPRLCPGDLRRPTATSGPPSGPSPPGPGSTPPWCTTTSAPRGALRGRPRVPHLAGGGAGSPRRRRGDPRGEDHPPLPHRRPRAREAPSSPSSARR